MSAAYLRRAHARSSAVPRGLALLRQAAAWLVLGACAAGTPAADLPEKARPDAEERPPRVAAVPSWSLAASGQAGSQARLDNGLSVRVLERPALPLLEL